MIIAVEYKDGRIKEFDFSSFTSGDALTCVEKNAKNMVTEFDLRTDNIERDGLILNVFWHDVTKTFGKRELDAQTDTNGYSTEMAFAQRRAGYSVMICNKKVLNLISRIIVYRANGAVQVAWRQGSEDWLIKGSLFEAQRVLTYTDASTTSLNAQASTVFAYLRRAHPTLSDAEIADMMGYPPDALEEIMGELGMQDVSVVGAEGPAPSEESSELMRRYAGSHFADQPSQTPEGPRTRDAAPTPDRGGADGPSAYEMLLSAAAGPNPMLAFDDDDEEDEEDDE